MRMQAREIVRLLRQDGWHEVRVVGSQHQYQHSIKSGTVTVAFHRSSQDIGGKTLSNIIQQAGIPLPKP